MMETPYILWEIQAGWQLEELGTSDCKMTRKLKNDKKGFVIVSRKSPAQIRL